MQLVNQRQGTIRLQLTAYILKTVLLLFGAAFMVSVAFIIYMSLTAGEASITEAMRFVVVIVTFILGWLIDRKHPRHTIALLLMLMAYTSAVQMMLYGVSLVETSQPDLLSPQLSSSLKTVGEIAWMPGVYIPFFIMPLYFPDGKLLSPRWRPLIVFILLCLTWSVIEVVYRPWPVPEWNIHTTRTAYNGIVGSEQFFATTRTIMTVLFLPAFFMTVVSVFFRYRRSAGVERIQMKWPIWAMTCFIIVAIFVILFPYLIRVDADMDYVFTMLLSLLLPISIGIAILQHRLFDIDIVLNRTIVYGSLTTLIVGFYVLFVSGFGSLLHTQTDTVSGLVATGIVAVLFQPVRERLQRAVNQLLYGDRDDPAVVLSRLAHHLETVDTPTAILPNLLATIAHALKVPYVAIWRPIADDRMEVVAGWGQATEQREMISLIYQNNMIGYLAVAPRGPGEQFSSNELSLLTTIAALTAITVRAVQLSDELRFSRQRIVTAREEERRRIRRDLHDGLGPQLASQTLGLEAISQLMTTNPSKARTLLVSLQKQSHEAILEVRRLIYDLRPPALDDLGLVGALQQSTSQYATGTTRFRLDAPDMLVDLPAAVETAVYRIAQEAMTNVVRHSQATHCTVRLACTPDMLTLEIKDDGNGLSENYRSGVGLQAMHERAAELNGETTVESILGTGTRVVARLPLENYCD